jgi:membrane-bound lytic murein transglycosylase B
VLAARGLALLCVVAAAGTAWAEVDSPDPPATLDAVEAPQPFDRWLADLLAEARRRGYDDELLRRTLAGVRPLPAVLQHDRRQPELTLPLERYLGRQVTPAVVRRGRHLAREHAALLARVEAAYGVPPPLVVAVWGLESRFGRDAGRIPVFRALATLAWEPRRAAFFRLQLYDALTMVARGDIDASRMRGSWAGAMGQPQFLPSSYLAFAVDFDGDGRRDIWTSRADVFASIANYLKHHGWRRGEPWGHEVRVTAPAAERIAGELGPRGSGCPAMRRIVGPASLADWQRLGVRRADGGDLPAASGEAGLLRSETRHFLVSGNYEALLGYNCAHHYALAVATLADRIGDASP